MKKRIFYSWQSDLPNNTNRAFINNALEKAIKEIISDNIFSIIPFLDRDTAGLAGSPDISASIFQKIDASSVFVCDVSIINKLSSDNRATPNPNVLVELGYAISKLGWGSIILVMNEQYGGVEYLPFDLRGRKVLTYSISSESDSKAAEKNKISSILRNGISEILKELIDREAGESKSVVDAKQQTQNLQIDQEANSKLNIIRSISYTQQKNAALINAATEYIQMNRYDLAVNFALDITYTQQKNSFLISIANTSIEKSDLLTAEKAIAGITYIQQRNALGMKLLSMMNKL